MVEFAFFFLLFLTLTVALMDFGRGIWTFTTLSHAARQGARYAMVHGGTNLVKDGNGNDVTGDGIETVVKANAVGLDPAKITVTPTWDPANSRGNYVQVRVSYPFQFVASPLFLAQDGLTLSSTSRMVIAN
jgi:Flp pilus assembly protein TadG